MGLAFHRLHAVGDLLHLLLRDTTVAVEPAGPALAGQDDGEVDQVDEVVHQHHHAHHLAGRLQALGHRGQVAGAADPAAGQGPEPQGGVRGQHGTHGEERHHGTEHNTHSAHDQNPGSPPCDLERMPDVDVQQHEDDEHGHRQALEVGVHR